MRQVISTPRVAHARALVSVRLPLGAAAFALLAGCQSGPLSGTGGGSATGTDSSGTSVQLIERDVEAPEIFHVEAKGLWDGRPSLGGVWVAAPDVTDPERVIIRNLENDRFVIGALFRRERDNPGPPLQISSDAAAALGVVAGAPTDVDVVALRREEAAEAVAAPAADAPPAVQVDGTEPTPLAEEIVQTAPVARDARPIEAEMEVAAASAPRRNFFGRLFSDRGTTRDAAASVGLARAPQVPTDADGSAVLPRTEVSSAAQPPSPARPNAAPDGGYVQIGLFSVEQNAQDTATALRRSGVMPRVIEEESRGRPLWRVVVGPASTPADRAAVIRKARALGFEDAFATRG